MDMTSALYASRANDTPEEPIARFRPNPKCPKCLGTGLATQKDVLSQPIQVACECTVTGRIVPRGPNDTRAERRKLIKERAMKAAARKQTTARVQAKKAEHKKRQKRRERAARRK